MDEERAKDLTYGTAPGSKRIPRLMEESELPEIYMSDGNPISDEPEEIKGRGARERTRVKYDDGLTEEQWLNAVDDDEDSPEAAAARKQARKERREKNRLKRLGQIPGDVEESEPDSEDSEPEPEPTPKKGRAAARKSGKVEKRKAEDDEEAPPAKRKRGGPGRPKASTTNGEAARHRSILQASLSNVYEHLYALESASDPGSDDDDEEPENRLIIGPFVKLPPKRDFADYYLVIQSPIAMNMIEKKIKKQEYSSLNDLRADIRLLCKNAKTYNEDGSVIFNDAVAIEAACEAKIREEINEHPELGDDDSSRNGGSAPTTTTGTPMPSGKLKLINSANYANGGSSGVQSDDDD